MENLYMPFKKKTEKTEKQHEKNNNHVSASIEDFNNTVEISFFYTIDKKLDSIDDADIIHEILKKYPELNQQEKDIYLRKVLIQVLNDDDFIVYIINKYNITILEFFKILYKEYSALFNALFIKKLKDLLKTKAYAKF